MVVDADWRARLEDGPAKLGPVDRGILERVRAEGGNAPILILRAANESGQRLWSFAEEFEASELVDVASSLVSNLMLLYRELVRLGIVLFVHTDFGTRELMPMRRGVERLLDQIVGSDGPLGLRELDAWILRNMLLYSSLRFEHVTTQLLPAHLALLERRGARAAGLMRRAGLVGPAR